MSTRLSRRQRFLYDEFIHRDSTQRELAKGDYLGMLNVLMQLRKVCNHPDLFDERTTSTPLTSNEIEYTVPAMVDIRDDFSINAVKHVFDLHRGENLGS